VGDTAAKVERSRRIRRSPPERIIAWIWTGPAGHLYGGLADLAVLFGRLGAEGLRARFGRPARPR
jgi:hypothetical protein